MWNKEISYEDDLREQIRLAKEFVTAHEGKATGPYYVKIEIGGSKWGDIVKQIAHLLDRLTKGPDQPMGSTGGGYGNTYHSFEVKKADEISAHSHWHPNHYGVRD